MTKAGLNASEANRRRIEDELVRNHLQLVDHCVSQIRSRIPRHVPREDLVSAGMAGLAQAARTYDASREIAFDRYASSRIRGAILDELRTFDWASRSVRANARKVAAVRDELSTRLGRLPTIEELAAATGFTPTDLKALDADVQRASVVHYEGLAGEDTIAASTFVGPEANVLEQEQHTLLLDAIRVLPDRLRYVVIAYFFDERQMQEIADDLGVTQSRVSQMRGEALALIRHGMNAQTDPHELANEPPVGSRMAKRKAAYRAAVASLVSSRSTVAPTEAQHDALVG